MAYLKTVATNINTLLDALVTFATANGWSADYNETAAQGRQIGLSSGACKVAIGEHGAGSNPIAIPTPFNQDATLGMALAVNFNPAQKFFWGHGNPNVNTSASPRRTVMNDLLGPFTEVHFFGGAAKIFVFIKTGASRWAHFGFGLVERQGGLVVPFAGGQYMTYWPWAGSPSQKLNDYQFKTFFGNNSVSGEAGCGLQINVPVGVIDPAFGFPGGQNFFALEWDFSRARISAPLNPSSAAPGMASSGYGTILDPAMQNAPQLTTGGMQLYSIPVSIEIGTTMETTVSSYIGSLPSLKLCRAPNVQPGASILQGVEEYLVFPVKQKGIIADTEWGGIDNKQPNSFDLCYAVRKD